MDIQVADTIYYDPLGQGPNKYFTEKAQPPFSILQLQNYVIVQIHVGKINITIMTI